jgi:uncharacterized surface protein with fasciclin (FAS1) repeats
MVRRQILVVTSVVLVFVVANESRAQYGGYRVGYGPPICCGTSYSPSYYQPCSPVSRGFRVRGERACRGHYRSSSVVYDYSPSQVYIDATTYRRFGPVPPPQFAAKPPVKQESVVASQPLVAPESGVAQQEPAVAPQEVPSVVVPQPLVVEPAPAQPPAEVPPTAPAAPPELTDLISTAHSLGNLSTLLELANLAALLDEARAGGPYTILAPDNEAFAKLPADQLEQLKANPAWLRQVVLHHVISDAKLSAADLAAKATPMPLIGPELKITKEADTVHVDGARIEQADIECVRGVIHVIDQVLIPPDVLAAMEEAKKK